jgi:hypothetical protein
VPLDDIGTFNPDPVAFHLRNRSTPALVAAGADDYLVVFPDPVHDSTFH